MLCPHRSQVLLLSGSTTWWLLVAACQSSESPPSLLAAWPCGHGPSWGPPLARLAGVVAVEFSVGRGSSSSSVALWIRFVFIEAHLHRVALVLCGSTPWWLLVAACQSSESPPSLLAARPCGHGPSWGPPLARLACVVAVESSVGHGSSSSSFIVVGGCLLGRWPGRLPRARVLSLLWSPRALEVALASLSLRSLIFC